MPAPSLAFGAILKLPLFRGVKHGVKARNSFATWRCGAPQRNECPKATHANPWKLVRFSCACSVHLATFFDLKFSPFVSSHLENDENWPRDFGVIGAQLLTSTLGNLSRQTSSKPVVFFTLCPQLMGLCGALSSNWSSLAHVDLGQQRSARSKYTGLMRSLDQFSLMEVVNNA